MKTLKTINLKDQGGIQGKYRFYGFKKGDIKYHTVNEWNKKLGMFLPKHVVDEGSILLAKPQRVTDFIDNKILFGTERGTYLILKSFIGATQLNIIDLNLAAIGTGTGTIDEADPALFVPVLTNILRSNQQIDDKSVVLRYFIADDELIAQEYKEFALYAGTQIFTHSLISPTFTKATNEDVIVEYIITVLNQ